MSESVLSSDILERQFGPNQIEILYQKGGSRVIRTIAGGRTVELSLVSFRDPSGGSWADIHRKVMGGESMGKAFRRGGVSFARRTKAVYACEPPPAFRRRFGAPGPATVVDVSILVGPSAAHYADILEVYAPAVKWPRPGAPMDAETEHRLRSFGQLLTELGD